MSTREYTSTVTVPNIQYTWKCSKCGKINTHTQDITVKAKNVSLGGRFSQEYSDRTSKQASLLMNSILNKMAGYRGSYADYREAKLNCSCERCHHKEVWAQITPFSVLKIPLIILAFIVAILPFALDGVFPFTDMEDYCIKIFGVLLVLYPCLFFFDRFVIYPRKELQLEELPRAALPIIVMDGVPVAHAGLLTDDNPIPTKTTPSPQNNKREGNYKHPKAEEQASAQNQKEVVYCRKCGSRMPADSVFCPKCGEKVKEV